MLVPLTANVACSGVTLASRGALRCWDSHDI